MCDILLLWAGFIFQVPRRSLLLYLSISLSLSLSAHNVSAKADIPIKTEKNSLNFLELYKFIDCRATADSLHVDVHVARIAKDKTFIVNLTISIIFSFSGRPNNEGVIFITAEMSTFLHKIICV